MTLTMFIHPILGPYTVAPLLAATLNFSLVIWGWKEAPRSSLRTAFLLWSFWIGLWNVGIAGSYLITDEQTAYHWWKFFSPWVVRPLTPLFLHFILEITESIKLRRARIALYAAYGGALIFTIVDATTPYLMQGVQRYYWGYYPTAAPADALYGPFFWMVILYAFRRLWVAMQESTGYRRNQFKYVFVGGAVAFGTGLTNFFPIHGIPIYPIGNLFNALYALLMAYAIIEYRLVDIRLLLRRGTVYTVLTGALTLTYISVVWTFKYLLSPYGINEQLVYSAAALPVAIVLAPSLKARIEPWIAEVPFWKAYRYPEILRDFGQSVLTVFTLSQVAERIVEGIASIFSTKSAVLYVPQFSTRNYRRAASIGRETPEFLAEGHPVVKKLLVTPLECIVESVSPDLPFAVTLPLSIKGRLIGIVGLGEKLSGDMFNGEDLHLLHTLAGPAVVALENAQRMTDLEERGKSLRAEHDTALLGLLATEMAHELAKPLTRILNEQVRLEQTVEGPSSKAVQRIQVEARRAADIMESFAMLAPHVPLERHPTAIEELIEASLSHVGVLDNAHIEVVRRFEQLPPISLNPTLILQVLTNLVQNASEAMDRRGRLIIATQRTIFENQACAEITVTDSGAGIPASLQSRVFEPFFTTKHAQGGRGVGLTLSRAMIERHGGSIHLESPGEGGVGTRAIIRLPIEEIHA